MNIIKQMRVSDSIIFFKKGLLEKYKLLDYNSNTLPAFFYGIYTSVDLNALIAHKSIKVIIWSGTDINYKQNKNTSHFLLQINKLTNVYHISNSRFIDNDLNYFKLPYKSLPICGLKTDQFYPVKKNKCVYLYTSLIRPHVYNDKIYNEVIKRLPEYTFIIAINPKGLENYKGPIGPNIVSVEHDKMMDLYKQCFVGLRLTSHDGIAYTVLELGLAGIRCIHNGNQPNAIKWQGVDDIVTKIKEESRTIGSYGYDINKTMIDYLNLSDDWKNIDFYTNIKKP